MLEFRRGTVPNAQCQLRARSPGSGQEGDRPRRLREGRDRRGEPGAPLPVREGRVSLSACDPARQVRRDTAAPQAPRDERDPLRQGQLQVPVLRQAPRRPQSSRSPDARPHQADLAWRSEHLGQRGYGLHQVQRAQGQPPPMECGMYPKTTPKEPRYVVMVWYSRGLNEVQRRYVEQFYGDGSLAAS